MTFSVLDSGGGCWEVQEQELTYEFLYLSIVVLSAQALEPITCNTCMVPLPSRATRSFFPFYSLLLSTPTVQCVKKEKGNKW